MCQTMLNHRSIWSDEIPPPKKKHYSVVKNGAENQIRPSFQGSTGVQKWTCSLKQLCSFQADTVDLYSKQSYQVLITHIIVMV